MALISDRANTFGDRDYQRWQNLLDYIGNAETKIRVARIALAAELGFDSRKPQNVKVGDRVRRGGGTWATVTDRESVTDELTGQRFIRFDFGAEAASLMVELASDYSPVEPQRLIVEVPELDEAF